MGEENDKLEQSNKDLAAEIARLKEQIDVMAAENAKFAENNENLKQEVINFRIEFRGSMFRLNSLFLNKRRVAKI